jgi:Pentapeptide repeats (9 copies)
MIETVVAAPEWPTCRFGHGCLGAQASPGGYCWRHTEDDDESAALDLLARDRELDLRGTEVSGYLLTRILDRLRDQADDRIKIRTARCTEASFADGASFERAMFIDDARFNGARFGGTVSFANARFERGAYFADAKFGTADSAGATVTSFDDVTFCQKTLFTGAEFVGLGTFAQTTFGQSVSFDRAMLDAARFTATVLGGEVSFRDASVTAELKLSLTGRLDTLTLNGLRAAGQVEVRAEAARVRCENATFDDRVTFLLANGPKVCLTDTVFAQPSVVESWLRPVVSPTGSISDQPQVRVLSLRGVDAEHLTLADVDLRQCLIYGLRRPDELRLSGRCRLAPTPRGWYLRWKCLPWRWTHREALYEEYLWRRASATGALGWQTETAPGEKAAPETEFPSPAGLAVLYRQLRQAVEDAKNEPGAADLYYGEMEMRRLSTQQRDERWLLMVYWLVSGYGLRASRSMLVLGALVLGSAVVLQRTGFPGSIPSYIDCLLYAAGSVLSLDLTGHLPDQLTDWGQLVRMVLRVGGPVLLGLGALAVRGRVKR